MNKPLIVNELTLLYETNYEEFKSKGINYIEDFIIDRNKSFPKHFWKAKYKEELAVTTL